MGTVVNCPFCNSQRITLVEFIPVSSFKQLLKDKNIQSLNETINGITEIKYNSCDECGLRFFFPLITGDSSYYESISSDANYYAWSLSRADFKEASKHIAGNMAVLDIGCGCGEFQKFQNATNYTGIEFNNQAVKQAQERGYNVFNEDIAEHAKGNSEKYDVIVCFQVIEHLSSPKSFLIETIKCLKDDGLLIISTPNNNSYLTYLVNASSNLPPHHVLHWDEMSLRNITRALPLEVVSVAKEILTDENKDDYTRSLLTAFFQTIFKLRPRLVDFSVSFKIFNKLAKMLVPAFNKVVAGKDLLPAGHTITMVYRKKSQPVR